MDTSKIILIIIGLVIYYVVSRLIYPQNDYKKKIVEELSKKGFELVDIAKPNLFDTGPFPAIEIRPSFIQTRFLGVSGEDVIYRIVRYKNKGGDIKQSWIKIETTAFQIDDIDWNPKL